MLIVAFDDGVEIADSDHRVSLTGKYRGSGEYRISADP